MENQSEWAIGVDAFIQLPFQGGFCLAQHPTLSGFLPREIGENCELILQIGCGDAIPKTIFEREHFSLFLFKTEDRRVRQMDSDFLWAQINGYVLLQIEKDAKQIPANITPQMIVDSSLVDEALKEMAGK